MSENITPIERVNRLTAQLLEAHTVEETQRIALLLAQCAFDACNENDALIKESRTDVMTGLPNKKDFFAMVLPKLEQFYSPNRRPFPTDYIIVFFDLDGLKNINDTHGHLAGNEAIINASRILNDSIRSEDWLGRIDTESQPDENSESDTIEWVGRSNGDSDEFTAVISVNGEPIHNVLLSLQRRISNKIYEIDPTLSIAYGVAIASQFDSPDKAFEHADKQMYENKKQNKLYTAWKNEQA